MQIEVWSDVVCPWCYIGKRRLEDALSRFPHAQDVTVVYRSFQLDPNATRSQPDAPPGVARKLADKYGMGIAEAERMIGTVDDTAREEGLDFRQDLSRGDLTLDAHRLLHEALTDGPALQAAVKERFLRAYFTEGERIDDPDTLARLAVEAGLDADRVAAVLAGDEHADAVREDQAQAAALGGTAVPFVVADRRFGVSGAQPADVFLQMLERAWEQRTPA